MCSVYVQVWTRHIFNLHFVSRYLGGILHQCISIFIRPYIYIHMRHNNCVRCTYKFERDISSTCTLFRDILVEFYISVFLYSFAPIFIYICVIITVFGVYTSLNPTYLQLALCFEIFWWNFTSVYFYIHSPLYLYTCTYASSEPTWRNVRYTVKIIPIYTYPNPFPSDIYTFNT